MFLCPLCNGIHTQNIVCPHCKTKMKDGGRIENYYDSYSPYLPNEILPQVNGVDTQQCLHLFYCPRCGYDQHHLTDLWLAPDLS